MQTEDFPRDNIHAYMLGSRLNQSVLSGLYCFIICIEIANSVITSKVKMSHQNVI